MNLRHLLPILVLLVLFSCGRTPEEGGGFETSDIHARVLTPAGAPAAGARVWLVASVGDSRPAQVVDSAFADTAGRVTFQVDPAIHSRLGLDATSGGWIGIAPSSLAQRDSATVSLTQSGMVSSESDANVRPPQIFVPGSHFYSAPNDSGTRSILRIPRGTWTVAVRTATGVILRSGVRVDTGLVLVSATADGLPVGPDIAQDSFRIGSTIFVASGTDLPSSWPTVAGIVDSFRYAGGVSDDTGRTGFHVGPDTSGHGLAAGVQTSTSANSGCAAVLFDTLDSNLVPSVTRILTLLDTHTSAKVAIRLDSASDFSGSGFLQIVDSGGFLRSLPDSASLPGEPGYRAATWYLTWSSDTVRLQSSRGWSRSVALRFTTPPVLRIEVRPVAKNLPATTYHVRRVRIYVAD